MQHLIFSLALLTALPADAAEPARWRPSAITSFDIQLNDPPSPTAIPNVQAGATWIPTCVGMTFVI